MKKAITWAAFILLYIPLLVLVIDSFKDPAQGELWTLSWYARVLTNGKILSALEVSAGVGFFSTLISTVVGTAGALALQRSSFRGKSWLEGFSYVPLVMPEIVLGLSLLIWFALLRLTLGAVSLVLAHITFSLSYVIITVRARLEGFDRSLEEAAFDLGARPAQVFWRVTFPLIWPAVLSGALMAFTLSFDDFLVSFFTTGPGYDTLPLQIYAMIKFGVSREIHALSTLMLGVTFVAVWFGGRSKT